MHLFCKIACKVVFGPAVYIRNDMECEEEERLAIAAGSTYIPRCAIDEVGNKTTVYDGCQCDVGDTEILSVCWCVDPDGNSLATQIFQFGEEMSWEEVCVDVLGCANSNVEVSVSASAAKTAVAQVEVVQHEDVVVKPHEDVVVEPNALVFPPMIDLLVYTAIATLAVIFLYTCKQLLSCFKSGTAKVHKYEPVKAALSDEESLA